jgi:putative ABC transport system substrate-binding protein
MRRRDFLASGAIALVSPLSARAQTRRPTIGILSVDTIKPSAWLQFLLDGLRERGYMADRNVTIDDRTVPDYAGLAEQAASLVRAKVDVIAALGATATVVAAKMTRNIPIVMVAGIDAVASGLAASIPHPGGNVSGINLFASELQGKRLDLLKELVPGLTRLGELDVPASGDSAGRLKETEAGARALKLSMRVVEVGASDQLGEAFAELARAKVEAVVLLASRLLTVNNARLAELAAQRRLPAISPIPQFVDAGGLMSYSVSERDAFAQGAIYIDRILKGAKPGDLPIQHPTKFELAVNLKAAHGIGIRIPQSILVRADKVIG